MKIDKDKPCPHCGEKWLGIIYKPEVEGIYKIYCPKCLHEWYPEKK